MERLCNFIVRIIFRPSNFCFCLLINPFSPFLKRYSWMSQAGAQDMVQGWALLTAAQRAGVKQDYAAASIKLVVTGKLSSREFS